ncbi:MULTISPECIES: TauD/TfdA dioxygenase family protein [Lentibacter]|jgi:taurine dioxygenase|uniref:Taurine dioxygenase n=1 Tax=Lentibacter algarum TaxID=576131 RepID=A0A1H3I629_9RHOB|nr:TauD/TfdA family dioxygenase [Lentibacter algarum]MCO4776281.1 TauD/TfdA family dioxygenase [Lentibacter algarum]MCO4827538.1 TauD/TfdA family dioxygenase [Lentibacter algarum]WIF31305.1 putative taurine catabolism dioxygenase [Lentibacter algarum]SDY22649.1 taurine dioxygenase [Lentibacter algarum]
MEIRPLTGGLGAEILGADVRDREQYEEIHAAFAKHSVIVLRDQEISPEDHLDFARRFGPININRFFKPVDGHPEIATVLKEKDQKEAVGEGWHTDHSYDQVPAMGSILHAIEMPPYGGDTLFVSMGAAYEALSEPMRRFLDGLTAIHSSRHVFGVSTSDSEAAKSGRLSNADAATQDAHHPVVIRHPLSGRRGIFVNPVFTTHIEGLKPDESAAILNMLYEHCKQPEFQCRVRWQEGDVTMWDNRATWHKAINDYQGFRRLMHRVTVDGVALSNL